MAKESEVKAEKKTLAGKLAEVAAEVAYIHKDKRNEFHRYSYASAEAVLRKVNPAVASRGISVSPAVEIVSALDATIPTKQGTAQIATVRVRLVLTDADSGETQTIEALGTGMDSGDKAIMKAQTAAVKYAWMMALSLATGDDPEADEATDEATSAAPRRAPAKTQEPQQAGPGLVDQLLESLADVSDDLEARSWWARNRGRVQSFDEQTKSDMRQAFGRKCRELGLDPNTIARNGKEAA